MEASEKARSDHEGMDLPEPGTRGQISVPETCDKPLSQWTSHDVGREGESLCVAYLENRGYEVLERNWRCASGEADVVALDGDALVLVEVKTRLSRKDDDDTIPELAVDEHKQERYRGIALTYLAMNPTVHSIRFDVVAIKIVGERCARLRHLVGAYGWDH